MDFSDTYKIIKPLGSQKKRKFGQVFLVERKYDQHKFVLKSYKKSEATKQFVENFKNEALLNFTHEGLPKKADIIETDTEFLVIRPYIEALTLEEFWLKIPRKEQLGIIGELIGKLAPLFEEMESKQIIHCDIKPANILIREANNSFNVYLIDFGIAIDKTKKQDRKTLFPLGYAAPELILNEFECIKHQSDLFSLGIIIWRLLVGKLPLSHPHPGIMTNLQITHPLPEHSNIPKPFFAILSKMCTKHNFSIPPNQISQAQRIEYLNHASQSRYQTLKEIEHDWKIALETKKKGNFFNRILFGNRY